LRENKCELCRFARRSRQRRAPILIFQIPLAQVLAQHLRLARLR
jgi:hypothetical protein